MTFEKETLENALLTLGELLQTRRQRFEVVAIGGGSLLLLGLIRRPTKDLDVVALLDSRKLERAEPLPSPLREAAADVASTLGLAEDWINPGPTSLLDHGLPEGFLARLEIREFGGLVVHIAGRTDQICFKFYATVDQGPNSKHAQDLRKLAPSPEELIAAARWARTHDPSDAFRDSCLAALASFGIEDADVL